MTEETKYQLWSTYYEFCERNGLDPLPYGQYCDIFFFSLANEDRS